jgi:hypothetical protein
MGFTAMIRILLIGSVIGILTLNLLGWPLRWGFTCLGVGLAAAAVLAIVRIRLRLRPSAEARSRAEMNARVRAALSARPEGRFAVYETPAGLRVLALHAPFDPSGEAACELFERLGTDPKYASMCAQQACFRARVSAKPWRLPWDRDWAYLPRGVWPVRDEHRPVRDEWIARFEEQASKFAACRFVEETGAAAVHPRCAEVQRLHDELSRARSDLPIA